MGTARMRSDPAAEGLGCSEPCPSASAAAPAGRAASPGTAARAAMGAMSAVCQDRVSGQCGFMDTRGSPALSL